MKKLYQIFFGVSFSLFLLVGCKELSKAQNDAKGPFPTSETADDEKDEKAPRKLISQKCQDDVFFLNVVAAEYSVEEKENGGKAVTCSLITNAGLKVSHTENYPNNGDPGFEYSSFCKIYFQNGTDSYWVTFLTPGSYTPEKESPMPSEAGWQIMNISNLPSSPPSGYLFEGKTCEVEEKIIEVDKKK